MNNLLRILTFNFKNDTILTSNKHRFETRYHYIKSILKTLDYDVLGVQELTNYNIESIKQILSEYHCVGTSRKNTNIKNDELSAIFFRKDRFTCLSQKTYWLSNTPNYQGSKIALSIFPRICTVAHLLDNISNKEILFINTHLDHLLPTTRKAQINKLIEIIHAYELDNAYIVITGDFNTTLNSSSLKQLIESNLNIESIYKDAVSNTIHHFKGKIKKNKDPIDHIFFDSRLKLVDYKIITDDINGNYPSDHYPVIATINIL